jgi:hypothetical protein
MLAMFSRSLARWRAQAAVKKLRHDVGKVDKGTQILLSMRYRELHRRGLPVPSFDDAAFRSYSQTGEDGILLLIFSLIGVTNRRVIEICAGNGVQSNSANWIINHGWTALLVEGDKRLANIAREFYDQCLDTPIWQPTIVRQWVTNENVNSLVEQNGFADEIDLLSLDLDGNDYWIWEALVAVRPRVVVVEYESGFGPHRSIAQRYEPNFVWQRNRQGLPSCGASLAAYVKLGDQKGYRLVGANRLCFNAFFLRADVGADIFPTVQTESCFGHPSAQYRMASFDRYLERSSLAEMWIEV